MYKTLEENPLMFDLKVMATMASPFHPGKGSLDPGNVWTFGTRGAVF